MFDQMIKGSDFNLEIPYDCAHEKRVLMAFFSQFQIFMDLYLYMSED